MHVVAGQSSLGVLGLPTLDDFQTVNGLDMFGFTSPRIIQVDRSIRTFLCFFFKIMIYQCLLQSLLLWHLTCNDFSLILKVKLENGFRAFKVDTECAT